MSLLIDKTLNNIQRLARFAGLNVNNIHPTRIEVLRSRVIYIINFVWFNLDVAGAFVWFFVGLSNSRSFTELTYVAPCVTFSCFGNCKSLYMIFNEKNIYKLIDNLRNLEIEEARRDRSPEIEDIIKKEHTFVTTVIRVLNIFYSVLLVTFALSPLILVAVNYFMNKKVELVLPFLVVYPFDPFDIRIWPFVYLRQIWSEVIAVMNICIGDYMFYTFCTYIRMQFRLLKYYIERVVPYDNEKVKIENLEELKSNYVQLIKWHQKLINLVNILETVYTRSTLFNFISSSILICLTGFNVMAISDMAIAVTFLSFLSMSLLQIFFLCFFGDLLMTASMEVSDAAYNCRWYLADKSFGKYILIVQTRTGTPCKLTASNFSEVNLKAFTSILSTAWSYFALLQTLYQPQRN